MNGNEAEHDVSDIQSTNDNVSQNVKNNKITDEKLQCLKKIYQKCEWYRWIHTKTYYYMYKIYICVHIPMMLINTIAAILNTNTIHPGSLYEDTIRYCSAVILLINAFFTSILNLLKLDTKLEYHKKKAADYIALSTQIEEYIMTGEETDATIRLYKTYLSYSTDNEYIVPKKIIISAEKTLNKKYINNYNDSIRTFGSPYTYIDELMSEIKKENIKNKHTKIKQLLTTKQTQPINNIVI